MDMTITQKTATMAVLHLNGMLEGSTCQALIDEAQKLYDGGVRDLVLDLGQLTFMSSAGISALHRVSLIFHAISHDRSSGYQRHVKLLNPADRVQRALDLVGFTALFEIHTDEERAAESFY